MKKMFLMLAVMLLVSAAYAADVTISCSVDGDEVTVNYSAATAADTPRGMGLNIALSSGTIASVTKNTSNGYWVYPGSIDVEGAEYNGTPVAAGGVGQSSMVIEMGALHSPTGVGNGPAQSGEVIKFTVDPDGSDSDITISADATRGGVVKYDATEADVTYTGCTVIGEEPECFPSAHPKYSEWLSVGSPTSWCHPKQCYGDASGSDEQFGRNNWVSVGSADLGIMISGYNKSGYSDPVTHPWISADFTRSAEQFGRNNWVRVGSADFAILVQYYNKAAAQVPADCLDVP